MNLWEEKLLDRQDGYEEGEKHGRAAGITEGEIKKAREIAAKMKANGMKIAEISEITGIPVDELEKL